MRWLLVCLALLAPPEAWAQGAQLLLGFGVGTPRAGATYQGPGDVVASATAWYGLRAYSAAYAGGKSVNIRRASDNTTQDINVLTNGNFDVASYNTFIGTDATGTCTISATTLSCTGLGSALHANDLITGTGITNPCILSSPGSLVGGAQTATAQIAGTSTSCGTVSVGETVVAQVAGFVTKAYDQTAGNACGSASCDILQATAGNQPQILPICVSSLPCIYVNSASQNLASANNFTPNAALQLSLSLVASQVSGTSGTFFLRQNGANNYIKHQSAGANRWQLGVAGSNVALSVANEGVWHAGNAVESAGTNASILNVDGTEVTATATPNATAGSPGLSTGGGSSPVYYGEAGFWDNLVFTSGNRTAECRNQQAYYGAGNFGATC